MSSPYRHLYELSKKAVASYLTLADACAFSTSPLTSASSSSVAISLAVAPCYSQIRTPVIRLQHLDLFFKVLFILSIAVVPLTKENEATEERIVR